MKRDALIQCNLPEKESQDEGDRGDSVGGCCRKGGCCVVDGHVEEVKTQRKSGNFFKIYFVRKLANELTPKS